MATKSPHNPSQSCWQDVTIYIYYASRFTGLSGETSSVYESLCTNSKPSMVQQVVLVPSEMPSSFQSRRLALKSNKDLSWRPIAVACEHRDENRTSEEVSKRSAVRRGGLRCSCQLMFHGVPHTWAESSDQGWHRVVSPEGQMSSSGNSFKYSQPLKAAHFDARVGFRVGGVGGAEETTSWERLLSQRSEAGGRDVSSSCKHLMSHPTKSVTALEAQMQQHNVLYSTLLIQMPSPDLGCCKCRSSLRVQWRSKAKWKSPASPGSPRNNLSCK